MPIYQYKGQQYEMAETDPAAAKARIEAYISNQPAQSTGSFLDKLKGTPDWMVSKPGQGWDDANAQAAGGDVTNPMAYLSEAQKTEQGALGKATGQVVNRGVQIGAGIAKGAVLNPVAAVAELTGQGGIDFSNEMRKSYEQQRASSGAEGFDLAELVGAIASPVNKLIPSGAGSTATTTALKAAGAGALGSVFNPVAEEGMTNEDILREKGKQAAMGAAFGGVISTAFPAFKAGARELLDKGLEMKPGQAFGGPMGTLMRQAESFVDTVKGVLGKDATTEKINKVFTAATVDEVLGNIGQKLPKVYADGQEAVNAGTTIIKKAYPEAFNKLGQVQATDDFMAAVRNLKQEASVVLGDAEFKTFENELNRRLINKFTPAQGVAAGVAGEQPGVLQMVYNTDGQKLHDIKKYLQAKIKNLGAGTDSEMYDAFKGLSDKFNDFVYSVDKSGSIRSVDKAYSEILRVAGAAKSAAATNGNFSPMQLVKEAASQTGTLQGGSGKGPLQQYAKQMQNIIGQEEGIKGTPITPSMLKNLGVGAGLGYTGLFNLPVLAGIGTAGIAADTLGWLAMKNPALYEKLREQALNQTGRASQGLFAIREQNQ